MDNNNFVQPNQQSVITQSTTIVTEGVAFSNNSTTVIDAAANINAPFTGDNGMTGSTLMEEEYGSTAVLTADMAPGIGLPNVPQYVPQEPMNMAQPMNQGMGFDPNMGQPMMGYDPNMGMSMNPNMGQPMMGFDPNMGMPMDPNMGQPMMSFDPNMGMPVNPGMDMAQHSEKKSKPKKESSGKGIKIAAIILLILAIGALIADGVLFGLLRKNNADTKYNGAADDGVAVRVYDINNVVISTDNDQDTEDPDEEDIEDIMEEED